MEMNVFFQQIFSKSLQNCMIVMNDAGIIIAVNQAFTSAFGYNSTDLVGNSSELLFIPEDRLKSKPSIEIETVIANGQAQDINYLLHKSGNPVWVAGESLLVIENGERYIVKLIHNIHTQKVLEHLLTDANELVEKLFDTTNDTPLILFDSELRIIKANAAFCHLFSLDQTKIPGKKLSETNNKFLADKGLRTTLRAAAIKGEDIADKRFSFTDGGGVQVQLCVSAKNLFERNDADRKTLMIMRIIK